MLGTEEVTEVAVAEQWIICISEDSPGAGTRSLRLLPSLGTKIKVLGWTGILEASTLKWMLSRGYADGKLQMTAPGWLRTFGDTGMGGVGEEDNLKVDSVLPDKLKKKRQICILKDWKIKVLVR